MVAKDDSIDEPERKIMQCWNAVRGEIQRVE